MTGTLIANTINAGTATSLTIQSAGTTAMTVDTSQNVGIGTTSPATYGKFVSFGAYPQIVAAASSGNSAQIQIYSNGATANDFRIGQGYISNTDGIAFVSNQANAALVFRTNATEQARIDSSGNLLVGATSAPATFKVYAERSGPQYGLRHPSATAGQYFFMQTDSSNTFYIQSQASNGVYLTNTGTSWNAVSDERAKDILEPITDATAKVASLRAIIGSYKSDDTKKRRSFLIAQDVQTVLPEAVDDTNPDNLGLAYSDVIPLLVAAIQELSAKNNALEASNAAFEARLDALEAK